MATLLPAIHVFLFCTKDVYAHTIGEQSDAVRRTALAGHAVERRAQAKCNALHALSQVRDWYRFDFDYERDKDDKQVGSCKRLLRREVHNGDQQ